MVVLVKDKPVSVVLATMNEEHVIGRTLASLRKVLQCCGIKAEIVVVDSSTDHTYEIAENYSDRVYKFSEKGVSKARNYGALRASGEILVFMDADSIPQNCIFQDLARAFEKKGVAAALPYVLSYEKNLTPIESLFYVLDTAFIKACRFVPSLLKFYNRGDFFAVRRETFLRFGGFNERLDLLEITDLLMKILRVGKIVILGKPVYESSRRLRNWGFLHSHFYWWRNYVFYHLVKKPLDKIYPSVR
jgi:glycosyltransferase involved in cell wall biosynthesis